MKTICCGENLLMTKDSYGAQWMICVWCGYGEEMIPPSKQPPPLPTSIPSRGKPIKVQIDPKYLDDKPTVVSIMNTFTEEGQEALRLAITMSSQHKSK